MEKLTRKELENLDARHNEILVLLDEIERVKALAERASAVISDEPRCGGFNTKEDTYINLILLKDELKEKLNTYTKEYNETVKKIQELKDPTVRTIFILHYLNTYSYDATARRMNTTKDAIKQKVARFWASYDGTKWH